MVAVVQGEDVYKRQTPASLAAYATPCAWLPAEAVIRPLAFSSPLRVLIL